LHKVALIRDEWESQTASPLLTGLETDGSFAISADGKQLVYARARYFSNLWMVEPGGSGANRKPETRQLTHGTSQVERPRFSPDGRSIVFNMRHQRGTDLYTIPITGGAPKQLTFMNSFSVNGFFSPDGKRIAFASTQGGAPRVWIVSADGGPAYPVSSGQMSDSFDVVWLPRLGILYQQTGNQNYYELDPNTHKERYLLADSSRGWIFSPVYSPDPGKLAVAWSRRGGNLSGIWIVSTNPYSERRIYDTPLLPIGWSSDGTSIFVVRAKRAAYRDVSVNLGETITEATVLAVPLNGGDPAPVVSLPFEEIGGAQCDS
jgi:Tol biopolymer transport system component